MNFQSHRTAIAAACLTAMTMSAQAVTFENREHFRFIRIHDRRRHRHPPEEPQSRAGPQRQHRRAGRRGRAGGLRASATRAT